MANTTISDEQIIKHIYQAVINTEGVESLFSNIVEGFQHNWLGKKQELSGIKIEKDEGEVSIDAYINVFFGCKIPQVAWDVQENVKKEIEEKLELKVKSVNVHVQGVCIKEENEK